MLRKTIFKNVITLNNIFYAVRHRIWVEFIGVSFSKIN